MPDSDATFSAAAQIRSLLVPLDGSRLAEAAVPPAIALGRAFGATVTLLHVLEHRPPETVHGEPHLTEEESAEAYLDRVAQRFVAAGVAVAVHVHANPENDVARSIVAHAAELGTDLVVLTAHGKSGLRGFLFGSIAQQVVRRGAEPVFMVQGASPSEAERPFVCRTIAVPLNGTAEAEAALPEAAIFARSLAAALHLIYAVPTVETVGSEQAATAVLVPGTTRAILDLQQTEASAYLARMTRALDDADLTVTAAVVRGEPATQVVTEAERVGADLLVLATHGRSGLGGLWAGSIGTRVLSRFRRPLLLVPLS